ncbi:MAG: hypothetical protein RQ715_05240 [Methylococcales bacterium]|nr:hypothetical protein [Methylococcales bacterium]
MLTKLHSVLVVAVETPPLVIYPDPIEQRIPAYRHYRNMAIPFDLETGLYQNRGDIVIVGKLGEDEVRFDASLDAGKTLWSPVRVIAELARQELAAAGIETVLNSNVIRLPLTDIERAAGWQSWRQAISDWYELEQSTHDYARFDACDAILEIGIADYHVFETQTVLHVLLKLIDPVSRQVIARAGADDFVIDANARHSLDNDSQAFKALIATLGKRLLNQALTDMGWHSVVSLAVRKQ